MDGADPWVYLACFEINLKFILSFYFIIKQNFYQVVMLFYGNREKNEKVHKIDI